MDQELIKERLKMLIEYIHDLEGVQDLTFAEFQSNKMLRRYVERTLHLAIEACLDLGNHIISELGLREPLRNRDIFIVLVESGYLEQDRQEYYVKMAGFRNLIVHDYSKIEPEVVYGVLQKRLSDLRYFAAQVKKHFLSP